MRAWLRSHLGLKRWASLRLNNWLWGIFLPSLWEWLSGRNEVSWESVEQHARLRPMPSQISVRVWESRGVVLPDWSELWTWIIHRPNCLPDHDAERRRRLLRGQWVAFPEALQVDRLHFYRCEEKWELSRFPLRFCYLRTKVALEQIFRGATRSVQVRG